MNKVAKGLQCSYYVNWRRGIGDDVSSDLTNNATIASCALSA